MLSKQKLIDRMNNLQPLIPATIQAVNQLPKLEGYLYDFLDPGELQITLNYHPTSYLKIRRQLAKNWQYVGHHFNELTGNVYVILNNRALPVELTLELELPTEFVEGANCRLVEVGHKTEVVVYGIECKE